MGSKVRLLEAPLDYPAELARFAASQPNAGAIVSFLGQVRGDEAVIELELRAYPPLTLPGLEALAGNAHRRWALDGVLIAHRVGSMTVGEPIVLVAAAARHRRAAFEAADYLMDHLKSESWLWKRERTAAGWRWIEPRPEDHADKARW